MAAGNQKGHSKVKNNNTMVHDKLFLKCNKILLNTTLLSFVNTKSPELK